MAQPPLITNAIKGLIKFSEKPSDYLPSLHFLNKIRKKRAQRREAVARLANYFIQHTDMLTFKVGFYDAQMNFIPMGNLEKIAEHTGLSLSRLRRALRDMVKAGYLFLEQITYTLSRGVIRTLDYVKTFTNKFFYELGIKHSFLVSQKHYHEKKHDMKKAKFLPKDEGEITQNVSPLFWLEKMKQTCKDAFGGKRIQKESPTIPRRPTVQNSMPPEIRRIFTSEALRIYKEKPPDDARDLQAIYKEMEAEYHQQRPLSPQAV